MSSPQIVLELAVLALALLGSFKTYQEISE